VYDHDNVVLLFLVASREIQRLLDIYSSSMTVELQQRAVEYHVLAEAVPSHIRQVCCVLMETNASICVCHVLPQH
jgi:dGTP triphosphohydrolase